MKFCFLLALFAVPSLAERIDLEIDPLSTEIHWTLGDTLHTVHGTFKLKRGDLWFDVASRQAGGRLVVDAASGESGSKSRDRRMNEHVLDSAHYPEITFAPDCVEGNVARTGDSEVQLHGLFTIHGAAHEMRIRVKTHFEQEKLTATISFAVPYVKWGMKDPSNFLLKVKDSVDIDIQTSAQIK